MAEPASYAVFRSEDMSLLQFILSREIAADVVRELGNRGLVSFLDVKKNWMALGVLLDFSLNISPFCSMSLF